MVSLTDSWNEVETSELAPLAEKGVEIAFECEPMALYEVKFRLKTEADERYNAALVQFLSAKGRAVFDKHVAPSVSAKLGRYCYLSSDPETGVGIVRFFAPQNEQKMRLRFRGWANKGRCSSARQFRSGVSRDGLLTQSRGAATRFA